MKLHMLHSDKDLAFLLRAARKNLGLTLRDMEGRQELHRSSISQWENGLFTPTIASSIKWAAALEHQLVLITEQEAKQWQQ